MLRFMYFMVILLLFFSLTYYAPQKPKPIDFNQHDYKCKPERIEVVSYDRDFVEYMKCTTFKYNRTCTAFNTTVKFKVDFGNKMEVIVQCYKFASNEYRLFPIRFQINVCSIIANNIVGITGFFKCGNFTGCPLLKNKRMHICNFTPDMSRLPPYIPSGRYMGEMYGLYLGKEIWVARTYAEVYRPIV